MWKAHKPYIEVSYLWHQTRPQPDNTFWEAIAIQEWNKGEKYLNQKMLRTQTTYPDHPKVEYKSPHGIMSYLYNGKKKTI